MLWKNTVALQKYLNQAHFAHTSNFIMFKMYFLFDY